MMFEYSYLIGVLVLGLVWTSFWFSRKDLRRQMLILSVLTCPLAPISQIFFFSNDYWMPIYIFSVSLFGVDVGIEEPLFAFFVGGIGSVLYEVIAKRAHLYGKPRNVFTAFLMFTGVLIFVLLTLIHVPTIWASICALFIISGIMLAINRSLFWDAFFSGVLFLLLAHGLYYILLFLDSNIFSNLWIEGGLSGRYFLGVPIEESIWFFAWGTFSGILYEFYMDVRYCTKT